MRICLFVELVIVIFIVESYEEYLYQERKSRNINDRSWRDRIYQNKRYYKHEQKEAERRRELLRQLITPIFHINHGIDIANDPISPSQQDIPVDKNK